jgi:hypothetical protein
MKKTAMQKMVGHINDGLVAAREMGNDTTMDELLLNIAKDLLKTEQEQIADAFHHGREERDWKDGLWDCRSGLDYYEETYNKTSLQN